MPNHSPPGFRRFTSLGTALNAMTTGHDHTGHFGATRAGPSNSALDPNNATAAGGS